MKRRTFTTIVGLLALISIAATLVVKVSEFPQVTTPGNNDLFLLASGATNKNIKYSDLKTAVTPTSLDASVISSGTLSTNRLSSLIADLGNQSPVEGDLFYYHSGHVARLAGVAAGYVLTANGVGVAPNYQALGGPAGTTNIFETTVITSNYYTIGKGGKLTVTNGVTTLDVAASSLLRVDSNQKIAAATVGSGLSFDGTTLSRDALTSDVTTSGNAATIAASAITDAKVSASAAIAKSKISTSSTWADAEIPSTISRITGTETLQNKSITSTSDGGNNTIKLKSYIVLAFPHSCDGVGAIISTNDNTLAYTGQAAFSGTAATNGNYVEYRITVPEDVDAAVDMKVERWKFRLGAADTAAQTYNIGMASVADSASYDSPTIGQWVALSFAGDASGASGDVETISNVTLTNWKSNVTAGRLWVIRVNRDGGDASTQTSYSGPLVISYGSTQ